MDDFFSFLHYHTVGDPIVVAITISGFRRNLVMFLLTLTFDLMCWRTLVKVWRTKPKLYIQSAIMNIVNRSLGTVLVSPIFVNVFLRKTDFGRGLQEQVESMSEDLSAWQKASALQLSVPEKDVQQLFGLGSICRVLFFIFLWNLFFTVVHRILHTRRFYWLHRFHHQWSEDVLPMATSAMHMGEYVLATVIPFLLPTALIPQLTPIEITIGARFVEFSGLVDHTPLFHNLSEALPEWLVTTSTHLEHHRVPSAGNYSGTNINFDWLVAKIRGRPDRAQKQQAQKKDKTA